VYSIRTSAGRGAHDRVAGDAEPGEATGTQFAAEAVSWARGHDPLRPEERRDYLDDIFNALAGFEQAKLVLLRACHRLGEERRELDERRR
jgi:hypothetical protein